ncbi:DUF4349 domain-containing protein [Candidatus Woesearchaeota archaeon]|nr:DUF4349 domain-containing protein [Candidatus Woesearchaeota archaeon]
MKIKEQLHKIKENWLLATLLLIIVGVLLADKVNLYPPSYGASYSDQAYGASGESIMGRPSLGLAKETALYYPVPESGDFAPDVRERKITKSANLASEVERNEFQAAEEQLKASITAADALLLSENTYRTGKEAGQAYSGTFYIKVESRKYEAFVSQVKHIGTITSFSENAEDLTGQYTDVNIELESEKSRLTRYKELLSKAETTAERIDLTDRIFDQERRIKYLEDSLRNVDQHVEYSTITIQLQEKPSGYGSIALVKLSELLRRLVDSFNNLLHLLFWALPYAVAALIVWKVVRLVKRKK